MGTGWPSILGPHRCFFPKNASANSAVKTTAKMIEFELNSGFLNYDLPVPIHCMSLNGFPMKNTEINTVKNFLVVVTIEQGSGPNSEIIMKMKICPKDPTKAAKAIL